MDQPQATHDTLQTLVEQLERRGDAPALVALHKEGLECWSARELAQAAKDVARMLRGAGVEPKQAVALFADNSPQWVAAALGIAEAGAVVAPFDVQLGDKVLRHVLEDSEARLVFTTSDRAERLQELAPKIELRLLDEDDGERSWKAAAAEGGEPVAVGPGDPAALFYTSGTTGPPKGVPLTHRNLAFQLESVREAKLVTEDDRALVPLPLHHVYPFVIGMLVPLALGVPVILPHALTGPEVVRAIREGEATVVIGVPRLYRAMLSGIESRATSAGRIAGLLFRALLGVSIAARRVGLKPGRRLFARLHERVGPRLRLLASGGAPLGPELARKLQALGWDVAIGYGLTETAPLITIRMPDDDAPGSVGQPIRGVEVRIDREAAPGDDGDARQGEVLVRGPNVFDGYRNLPEKTREALDDDGWFRTGDLGYEERDGFLYLTGRASEVLVTEGGKNIQPDEVEEAYLEQPALREMAVLMKDDRLVALVVPDSRHLRGRDEEGMREAVQEAITAGGRALPSYQRVSDFAITRESLPRTRLGKLRRHLLPDRYDEAKAGKERAGGPVSPEEMSGEDRALVSDPAAGAVWEWLAQRYANQPLTPDTSLQMDLGIDSLEWVNLTLEVSQRAGVELTEDAIAEVETVRDLLQQVAQAGEGEGPDLREHPEKALSERQRRWLTPLPPAAERVADALRGLNRWLVKRLLRFRVEGGEHLQGDRPLLIAPNHVSALDPFVVAAVLDRERLRHTFWGGWVGIAFGNPLTRAFSRLARAVPIAHEKGAISSLAFGAAVLKEGESLVWFPEGERSESGELQPLKPGVSLLLEAQPVTVLPIFLRGTRDALPPGRLLPVPGKDVTVTVGEPVDPDQLIREGEGEDDRQRLLDGLHRRLEKLAA